MKWLTCLLFLFPVLLLVPLTAQSQEGTGQYNVCILTAMKNVTSDVAAQAIKNACADRWPTPEDKRKSVTFDQSDRGYFGTRRARITKPYQNLNRMWISVTNDSLDLTLTQVKVLYCRPSLSDEERRQAKLCDPIKGRKPGDVMSQCDWEKLDMAPPEGWSNYPEHCHMWWMDIKCSPSSSCTTSIDHVPVNEADWNWQILKMRGYRSR